ncbi:MAG: hypothetical protein F4Z65_10380 [Acidobacteria bacterium]|nr:hypothetical protein [Acidobacteriota bacterium]MYA46003.1 hypothetical protein [Acidobacteriota bacterium]MYI38622.1 hypothetical protein [Acidobacteriota bacterium]
MSESTIPPAETVAAPRAAPYTGDMDIGRPVPVPWWREAVRSWVPVLGIAAVLVFQMVSLQQQIGDLRTDFHREMGDLRTDIQRDMGDLRTDMQREMGDLRDELRTEMSILGERITRLETLLEPRAER